MFPGIDQFPDQFQSNILLVKKKEGENCPCINLKALKKFIIQYKHFKMEGLHCLKYLLEKKDFLCKIDLKDSYFSVPLCNELKKVCEICSVGKSLRVSLPLLWIRACSQDIFKTIKGTNSSTEAAEYSSSDTSRRYSSDGQKIRGKFNESRHIGLSASTSGFCHKSEKISSETITRVFRPKNRYPHHDFGTNRGKYRKGNFEMPESPFSLSNQCFGINKIDRSDVLNCPSNSACLFKAKVFTTTTTTITKPSLFIPGRDSIKKSVKTGTFLRWVENLRSNNQ